jgi:hypothetical protein
MTMLTDPTVVTRGPRTRTTSTTCTTGTGTRYTRATMTTTETSTKRPLTSPEAAVERVVDAQAPESEPLVRREGLTLHIGDLTVDVPRTLGFYGGLATATAIGLLEPPLGVFIAAIPVVKMLSSKRAPQPARFVAQMLEGAAQPVGSSGQGTIRLADS